ncbi:DUF485 domain-containing protein [Streptacidiphilus cavernicola]|uniref:DUF485 domain-containing protein n=1 Tax=Streptacidiphilus cavernicola TaxID=3342716 RepID=A0ABV6W1I4_9ACTN
MPAGGVPREDAGVFDWWAAPEHRSPSVERIPPQPVSEPDPQFEPQLQPEPAVPAGADAEAAATAAAGAAPVEPAAAAESTPAVEPTERSEVIATAAEPEWVAAPEPAPEPPPEQLAAAAVYRHVQAGEEFQEVRRAYRGFVFPACLAFLAWYLIYIVAAVTLPRVMDRPVAGPFNVAWVLGLLQFASTFAITWLYARHARDRRDRAALGLRWETQDRLR